MDDTDPVKCMFQSGRVQFMNTEFAANRIQTAHKKHKPQFYNISRMSFA